MTTFAAFIMTYERPDDLTKTVRMLLSQSVRPEKILVVDNSLSDRTRKAVGSLEDPCVAYYSMGYNAGPAGAAMVGLSELANEGYQWILWGDDDDPPPTKNSIEEIFEILAKVNNEQVGIIGKLGGRLNKWTGRTTNFRNKELCSVVDADYIPGNKLMIVNADVIRRGILPTKELFFGFEELDFCLKVKDAGFRVIFDGDLIKKRRIADGHTSDSYKWRGKSIGDKSKLWRQYYSTRNLLHILRRNRLWLAFFVVSMRTLAKMAYSFRFGIQYGLDYFAIQRKALGDAFLGNFGKVDTM